MLHDVSFGALTQLWAGTMAETVQYNGEVCDIVQFSKNVHF